MGNAFDVDWVGLFSFSQAPAETIIRGTATYWFLFLSFRFIVRRDIGAVGIADILVLVIVADALQNAMAGQYTSISDGMLLVSTLIGWNVLLDRLSFRFPRFRRFAEPSSLCLVKDGHILQRNMCKEFITEDELWAKLREAGIESLEEVKDVRLEADGAVSVIKRKK